MNRRTNLRLRLVTLYTLCLLLCSGALAVGRIAFVTPSGQLATVAPDGLDLRTLTPQGEVYQFPAWSPSGGRVAAVGSGARGGRVVVVEDQADPSLLVLYESEQETPIYLYWAPDGQKLGFLANHPDGLSLNVVGTIDLNDAATDAPTLVTTGSPLYWQWQGDRELFVHSGVGRAGRLAFTRLSEGWLESADAAQVAEPGAFNVPGVSASGDFLAYAEAVAGGGSRVVLERRVSAGDPTGDPADERVRREVPHEGLVALAWNPQADLLAFMTSPVTAPHPYGPVRLLNAEDGDLTTLIDEVTLAFFWSPDGEKLAYLTPVAGRGGGQLAQSAVQRVSLSSAPPARWVQGEPLLLELGVFILATGDRETLATFPPTPLFMGQFLPFFDQYALSHALWSPDSDALVLPVLDAGRTQVVVVPLDGAPQVITEGEMPFWSP